MMDYVKIAAIGIGWSAIVGTAFGAIVYGVFTLGGLQ